MFAVRDILAAVFIAAGMFFCIASVIGYIRLPDFYARCHASGLSETLALLLTCIGLIIYGGATFTSVKLLMLFIIVFICNPIGSHAICNAAHKSGLKIVTKEDMKREKEGKEHADSDD